MIGLKEVAVTTVEVVVISTVIKATKLDKKAIAAGKAVAAFGKEFKNTFTNNLNESKAARNN